MSKIAKQIINVPGDVNLKFEIDNVLFKGPLGEVLIKTSDDFSIDLKDNFLSVIKKRDSASSCMHGTIAAHCKNAIIGVTKQFSKKVTLFGVGFKVLKQENVLEFYLGYSHSIKIEIPSTLSVDILKPTEMIVKSCDKLILGDFCAKLAKLRKVEPYKGKGVILEGKYIKRKEGKRK